MSAAPPGGGIYKIVTAINAVAASAVAATGAIQGATAAAQQAAGVANAGSSRNPSGSPTVMPKGAQPGGGGDPSGEAGVPVFGTTRVIPLGPGKLIADLQKFNKRGTGRR